jgi:hypothetical protein
MRQQSFNLPNSLPPSVARGSRSFGCQAPWPVGIRRPQTLTLANSGPRFAARAQQKGICWALEKPSTSGFSSCRSPWARSKSPQVSQRGERPALPENARPCAAPVPLLSRVSLKITRHVQTGVEQLLRMQPDPSIQASATPLRPCTADNETQEIWLLDDCPHVVWLRF